jgi:hypothetical protein
VVFFVEVGVFIVGFFVLWFLVFERFFSLWGFFDVVCEGVFGWLFVF